MFEKTCCVTGHRNIQEERSSYVEQELRREVLAAIQDGYTRFISGFAEGADLMFAAIVAEQKEHNPDLFLEAAIPYAGRLKTKNKQFHELLRACDGIKNSMPGICPLLLFRAKPLHGRGVPTGDCRL